MHHTRATRGGCPQFLTLLLVTGVIQFVGACADGSRADEDFELEFDDVWQPFQGTQSVGVQGQGAQGQGLQGKGLQGKGLQGTFSGAIIDGKIPVGYQLGKALQNTAGQWPDKPHWYFPQATAIVNASTLSTIAPSAASPFYLTGVVRPSPGVPFSGVSGDTVNLRLVAQRTADTTSNLFALPPANPYAPPDAQSNADVNLYKVEWQSGPSTWQSLCSSGGDGVAGEITSSGTGWAMFVRGTYDAKATASELKTNKNLVPGAGAEFTIACTNGAVAKCARQWGYKPWKSAPNQTSGNEIDLRPFHQMCLRAARADYCADGSSLTIDGTMIDMADNSGFVQRESEHNTSVQFAGESIFTVSGSPAGRAWCLQKTRYDEITAAGTCTTPPLTHWGSCDPYYGSSYFSRDLSNLAWGPLIWVGTKSYCSHKTSETGAALAYDCDYCTRRICDPGASEAISALGRSSTTAASPAVGDQYCCLNTWDAQCVSEAAAWCAPSVWSNRSEFGAWKVNDPVLETDWYALKGPNGEPRWDFHGIMKDYGALGTAPFGTPAGFPANSSARWVGNYVPTQESDYFRFRFRGWKTGAVKIYVAAYNEFQVYLDGVWRGSGATPGATAILPVSIIKDEEHLLAISTKKPGGGSVFALDIR